MGTDLKVLEFIPPQIAFTLVDLFERLQPSQLSTTVSDLSVFNLFVLFCLGVDGWMNLSEIDPDEEVQGEIHLQISVQGHGEIPRKLCCKVLEAR